MARIDKSLSTLLDKIEDLLVVVLDGK